LIRVTSSDVATITSYVVVTFKGFHDLREWFGSLTRQNQAQESPPADAEM